jgi:hypothetical protein
MFMGAVAGITTPLRNALVETAHRPRMPEDDEIGAHRFQVFSHVQKTSPLARPRGASDVYDIAESRFAASSNDVRVRVLGSTKRLMTVFFPEGPGPF